MAILNAYISFNGNCEEAFNFYKLVFGGDFSQVARYKDMPSETPIPESDKGKIMHISLPISKETLLMGSDTSEAFGHRVTAGDNFALSINVDSVDEAMRVFNELSEGGTVKMPMEKTFWGALFGMFTDKFGIHWMVSYSYGEEK